MIKKWLRFFLYFLILDLFFYTCDLLKVSKYLGCRRYLLLTTLGTIRILTLGFINRQPLCWTVFYCQFLRSALRLRCVSFLWCRKLTISTHYTAFTFGILASHELFKTLDSLYQAVEGPLIESLNQTNFFQRELALKQAKLLLKLA